ncbi:PleD family two-component system response regulator [Phenylobacterium sp.]|uniref:response regulator n=1 Tax=Phenylobacterium sp. TaxID=1871053 RepID=UPI0027199635|nr:response regulator [Phenylobacterium sp.]MDO8801553.1 response regulator [Phenylobacterium sp.]
MHILVIDDDPLIRMMVTAVLTTDTQKVTSVENGMDGLVCAASPPPDLVLLDVSMPDVSGFDLLPRLRKSRGWERTPILMLTAENEIENIVRARREGARGYICKPVQPETLMAMVNDILHQPDIVWLDDYTRLRRPA